MTMEPWRENSYLLRFEHILEQNEDENYSRPVTFDLIDVFGKLFNIASIRETNLAGNQWLSDVKRFKFRAAEGIDKSVGGGDEEGSGDGYYHTEELPSAGDPINDSERFSITLKPMQIRTFVISVRGPI